MDKRENIIPEESTILEETTSDNSVSEDSAQDKTAVPQESPEKASARAQMENIFNQVSVIKAEEAAGNNEQTETQTQSLQESNITEIEIMTRQVLTNEEKAQQEREQEEKQKQKNIKSFIKTIIFLLVAGMVVLGGYVYVDYMPKNAEGSKIITIPAGAGTGKIANELKKHNLIHSKLFFKIVSKFSGMDGNYNYGKFEISNSSGYQDIFKTLSGPGDKIKTVKVTIPEGYEIYKVADLLEQKGLIDKDKFNDLIDNGDFDYDFIKAIPKREMRLEGYLFPDTYFFAPNDEYGIINEMLGRFEKVYLKYEDDIKKSEMELDDIITLASIIEREAGSADKKLVSSVFHNRINSDEYPYLQSCATVQYVLKERKPVLSLDDTKIDSPYNTYLNKGLPIGPIRSPGEESIEAALNPENTDYYFFVLGKNGEHHFSTTYQEHLKNKDN